MLARRDLDAARMLAATDPTNAAFHAQQAAEKLVKAALSASAIRERTRHHQIAELARQLPESFPWRVELVGLDRLTEAATVMRYPTEDGSIPQPLEPGILAEAIAEIESLLPDIEAWCRAR